MHQRIHTASLIACPDCVPSFLNAELEELPASTAPHSRVPKPSCARCGAKPASLRGLARTCGCTPELPGRAQRPRC